MAVKIEYNHLPLVRKALSVGVAQAVNQTAARIRDEAKRRVPSLDRPGPWATGALQASIHVVTEDRSDYDTAVEAAREIRAMADEPLDIPLGPFINPPTEIRRDPGFVRAYVVAPLNYAYFIENGSFGNASGRAPGPFMGISGRKERKRYENRVGIVVKRLGAVIPKG